MVHSPPLNFRSPLREIMTEVHATGIWHTSMMKSLNANEYTCHGRKKTLTNFPNLRSCPPTFKKGFGSMLWNSFVQPREYLATPYSINVILTTANDICTAY